MASAGHFANGPAGETLAAEDLSRFDPILVCIDTLLTDLILWGLDRTTAATLERIESLRIAAESTGVRPNAPRHAGLGRLAGALSRLGTRLREYSGRVVTTTELDVLAEIAVTLNLLRAIRANTGALPLSDFAGATHKEYVPAPPLDVQGLGLEAWISPGYAGVTAYVADLRTGRILTRTATRQAGAAQARPPADWAAELAEGHAFGKSPRTLRDLASHRFVLSGALLAPDSGRLSGSQETALAERPRLPQGHPRLRAFMLLGRGDAVRIARRLVFDPLGRPPHSPPVALLPVLSMTASDFDQKTQELSFQVTLPGGTHMDCRLTFRDDRETWIDQLETLSRTSPPPRHLFARLSLQGGALRIEPLTAYFRDEPPQHLTLG
jgi:HAMP domain-containing protein